MYTTSCDLWIGLHYYFSIKYKLQRKCQLVKLLDPSKIFWREPEEKLLKDYNIKFCEILHVEYQEDKLSAHCKIN